jgi:hypothetical protein
MNVGSTINAAGEPVIVWLRILIDGCPKYAGSEKMRGGILGGGSQRQNRSSLFREEMVTEVVLQFLKGQMCGI